MVLSPVVVPWTMVSVRRASSSTVSPSAAASCDRPASTPTLWSSGVVGAFSSTTDPSGRSSTQSVKVPPTSMPIR